MTVYSPQEIVMTAFLAKFVPMQTATIITTLSRKLKLWGNTNQGDRPCLFIHELDNDVVGGTDGRPQVVTMHINLFIYTWAKDDPAPAALLNPIIDGVFQALKPSPLTGKQNLGINFVDHCWVTGKVFKDAGDLDGDGMAIVPVSIRYAAPLTYP